MDKFIPCKNLDYSDEYAWSCELRTLADVGEPQVRYWERKNSHCKNGKLPRNVQFCGLGRGRINSITDCYTAPGPVGCYSPERKEE